MREELEKENINDSDPTEMKLREPSFSHYPCEINKVCESMHESSVFESTVTITGSSPKNATRHSVKSSHRSACVLASITLAAPASHNLKLLIKPR